MVSDLSVAICVGNTSTSSSLTARLHYLGTTAAARDRYSDMGVEHWDVFSELPAIGHCLVVR